MKKSLIALAAMAVTGAAMAQSNVELYGTADIWLGSVKGTTASGGTTDSLRDNALESGGWSTSKFGIRGSEDLGGGLKANFQLEQGFNADDGSMGERDVQFNRQAWVGLSGNFGEVQFGRMWTSYDDIRASANDSFGANVAASFNTWVGYEDRTSNGIKYITPEFGGFSGSFTYALGEDKTATNSASSLLSLGAQYSEGPLFVGFAHQVERQRGANGIFSPIPGIALAVLEKADIDDIKAELGAAAQGKTTYNLLNGSYDFGMFKAIAGFNQAKHSFVGGGSFRANEWNLGVEVPVASNISAGLGYAASTIKSGGVDQFKSTGYTATVMYSLSQRTNLYAVAARARLNDRNNLVVDSVRLTQFAVGVNHSF